MFERMDATGCGYVARAEIGYLASTTDPAMQVEGIWEPLPTIRGKILADYSAIWMLQQSIDEIERTVPCMRGIGNKGMIDHGRGWWNPATNRRFA